MSLPFAGMRRCRTMTASMYRSRHPASDAIFAGSLPAASRHRPLSGCRRRQAGEEEVQGLPDRYFHIDIAEVHIEEGKLQMFVAIDRTSKFAFVELHDKATAAISRELLLRLIFAVPTRSTPRSPTTQSSSRHLALAAQLSR